MTENYITNWLSTDEADALQKDLLDIAQEKGYKVNPGGQLSSETSTPVNTLASTYAWITTIRHGITKEEAIKNATSNIITHAKHNLNPCLYVEWREVGLRAYQMYHAHMTMDGFEVPGQKTKPTKADWYAFYTKHKGATTQPPAVTDVPKATTKATTKDTPKEEPYKPINKVGSIPSRNPITEKGIQNQATFDKWVDDSRVSTLVKHLENFPDGVIFKALIILFADIENMGIPISEAYKKFFSIASSLRGK